MLMWAHNFNKNKITRNLTLFHLWGEGGGVKLPSSRKKLKIWKIGAGQRPEAPLSELKFSFTCFLKFLKHAHVANHFSDVL